MKRLLLVDTVGLPKLKEELLPGTEMAISASLSEAFEQLKSKYALDQSAWDALNPSAPTPVQAPHFERSRKRREAELKTRLPYWDAMIVYIESRCDSSLSTAIGCATIAAHSGCKYIRILELSDASFNWYPNEGPHDRWIRLNMNSVEVDVSRRIDRQWYSISIQHELRCIVLNREGYDGCLRHGTYAVPSQKGESPILAKDLFGRVWPGL